MADNITIRAREAARSVVHYVEHQGWYPNDTEAGDPPDVCADAVVAALVEAGQPLVAARRVECEIEWIDTRSAQCGDAISSTYVWVAEEWVASLSAELAAAEVAHRVPSGVRCRTVTEYADGARLLTAWRDMSV